MGITFEYNLTLKRNETKNFNFPNLKSNGLVLKTFSMDSTSKMLDVKLKGKDNIFSYGEAVLYNTTSFDLSDQISQIIESDELLFTVKNLGYDKDLHKIDIKVTLLYDRADGDIIYNNMYTNLNEEGMAHVIDDIRKAGKHITKIIFTSPNKMSALRFIPQFKSDPEWLSEINALPNNKNQIVIDLSDEKYDADFVDHLKYYYLIAPDNVERLGLIVYGYSN